MGCSAEGIYQASSDPEERVCGGHAGRGLSPIPDVKLNRRRCVRRARYPPRNEMLQGSNEQGALSERRRSASELGEQRRAPEIV